MNENTFFLQLYPGWGSGTNPEKPPEGNNSGLPSI